MMAGINNATGTLLGDFIKVSYSLIVRGLLNFSLNSFTWSVFLMNDFIATGIHGVISYGNTQMLFRATWSKSPLFKLNY